MNPKLQGFFDKAQQTAEAVSAADTAEKDAETRRKAALSQNQRELKEMVEAEFGPIVDALKSLPEKDGKKFVANMSDETWGSTTTEARYNVTIKYDAPPDPNYGDYGDGDGGGWVRKQPTVSVEVARKADGTLSFRATQGALLESSRHGRREHKFSRPADFEGARQELALGLGTFAADRMPEIGAALGAAPENSPAPAASTTSEDPEKIGVMKPLHFRGSFGDAAAPQEAAATRTPATGPAPKKQPFWKRLSWKN